MARVYRVAVLGKTLSCAHCGHERFSQAGFAHFGTWMARVSFDCLACGHAHVFLKNAAIEKQQL